MSSPKTDYLVSEDEKFNRASRQLANVEERNRILSLIRAGATYEDASRALAEANPPIHLHPEKIREIVHRYYEMVRAEDAMGIEELRALENERLDYMQRQIWSEAREGNLKAIDRVIRISERRAKMNGLDAPLEVTHRVSDPLKELGIDEEHLQRAREAWEHTFDTTGEEITDEAHLLVPPQGQESPPADDQGESEGVPAVQQEVLEEEQA